MLRKGLRAKHAAAPEWLHKCFVGLAGDPYTLETVPRKATPPRRP